MRYSTPPKENVGPPKLTPSPGSSASRSGDSPVRQEDVSVFHRLWDASTQCFDTGCTNLNELANLGISKMKFEKEEDNQSQAQSQMSSLDRRKQRYQQKIETLPPAPFEELSLPYVRQNRNISELTMKSSWANNYSLKRLPDNKRMAYYAVGRHHKKAGGNRRCYFTGKLILNTAFYAGCVEQGLKTLVVFCLPSALGLPDKEKLLQAPPQAHPGFISVSSRASRNSAFSKRSQFSNLDDLSLSVDGDLDPNWGMDRDYLANVLPDASRALMQQMSLLYPQEFATLPVQVRQPQNWRLYTRFCFFSGLPIASNELHYKLRDDICQVVYEGDEILLSHEVMETVNQDSADILWLPNTKTFQYIRKHYSSQCSKLNDSCFERANWERIAPEV